MTHRPEIYVTTARVLAGASTDVLRALARDRAFDPSVFDEREPFFWLNEISSDRMDSYYGYMDAATTLPNFAADAAEGRAFLAGHNHRSLPFGYTLTGAVERGEVTRVLADAYTLRGLDLTGVQTDSFVDGVRAGVVRDVSVGFSLGDRGWYRCNVCGNDLWDYGQCRHWPGLTYEVKGADDVIRQVLCTFTVIEGRLSEVSAVYDGATPSAGVVKAQEGARMGLLDDRQIAILEQRYRCALPARRVISPGVTLQERAMPPETTPHAEQPAGELLLVAGDPDEPAALRQIMAACDAAGAPSDLLAPARVQWLADELSRLRPLADDGRAYRDDLVGEALAEGVRALGQAFREETYRGLFARATVAEIRQFRDDWRDQAAARLPGGRQSRDEADPPATPEPAPAAGALPAHIYQH